MFKRFAPVLLAILAVSATLTISTPAKACWIMDFGCLARERAVAARPVPPAPIKKMQRAGWKGYDAKGPSFHRPGFAVQSPGGASTAISMTIESHCLAEALLGEAWEEEDSEIIKVADTVKNRLHEGFLHAKTICQVVHKWGYDRAGIPRCQFSFACYGRRYDYKDWSEALAMAKEELARPGVSDKSMIGVIYYYNPDLCRPTWAKSMKEASYEGSHRFMRDPNPDPSEVERPNEVLAYAPLFANALAYAEAPKARPVPVPAERPTLAIEAAAAVEVARVAEAAKAACAAANQPVDMFARWNAIGETTDSQPACPPPSSVVAQR